MKCPNCGNEVYAVDTFDSEWENGRYYDTVEGCCRQCGKIWQWVEVYVFSHCEDIEGVEIDDHL